MRIRWLGHACFQITSDEGITVLTDPFDETVGYLTNFSGDIVTVSHDHYDHSAVKLVQGRPVVIREPQEREVRGIKFRGIETMHDKSNGAQRGPNTVFVFNVDGLNLCHLGDLGHLLSEDQLRAIGDVDVLFVPVGGTYTINASEADQVISALKPKVIIPMHYKTDALTFPIDGVDKFLRGKTGVEHTGSISVVVDPETLSAEPKVLVLEYQ